MRKRRQNTITGGKGEIEIPVKQLSFVSGIGQRIRIMANWIMFRNWLD